MSLRYIPKTDHINTAHVECELATLCLQYLTFDCFHTKTIEGDLEGMVLDGDMAFQDYATSKWFWHVYSITEPENISTVIKDDEDSRTAMINFGTALRTFTTHYRDLAVENSTVKEESLQRCLPFMNCGFIDPSLYSHLLLIIEHTLFHQRRGFEARNEISIPSLKQSLERNRKSIESLFGSNTFSEDEGVINRYGDKHFKCSKVNCYYFHEGFKDPKVRDTHVKRHTRPYLCPEQNCTVAEFGFVSNNELDKHKRVYHPEIGDKLNSFESSTKTVKSKHRCDVCGKEFTRSVILKEHTLSHFGQRPHPCSQCGKAFTRKNDCVRHEKRYCRNR
jgi:hypothetical protein